MSHFEFHSDESMPDKDVGVLVRVPFGITDKYELLKSLGTQLRLPEYFGFNWDALDECLADLSWLEKEPIVIWHDDLPLSSNSKESTQYVRILAGVYEGGTQKTVIVSFPDRVKEKIRSLMRDDRGRS